MVLRAVGPSPSPETLTDSFSFYLPATRQDLIVATSKVADAVVVRGAQGPHQVKLLRALGWEGTVLFDYAAYEPSARPIDRAAWLQAQSTAGADRLLTPGRWVPFHAEGDTLKDAIEIELRAPDASGAETVLLAIDSRWLTTGICMLIDELRLLKRPVALVLSHAGDPLGRAQAVTGLLALAGKVPHLSILRSDHGAIGAVAYGAVHASLGLRTTYRHFVPPGTKAVGIPNDRSARVFVRDLMDWFSAFTIAGWGATDVKVSCAKPCCDGQQLARFLDDRTAAEAECHNYTVLADLARHVLDAPFDQRRRLFGGLCADAVERHGPMGKLVAFTKPKPQLLQWAQCA